ncbi:MAG: LamG domain-containing protein, partial [Planctomycetota bacterium]
MFGRSLPLLLPALALTLSATAKAQGNALLFDGNSDQCRVLNVNGDFDFGNSFTLEAWVRVDSPQPNAGIVATDGDSAGLVGVASSQAAAIIVRPVGTSSFQSSVAPALSLPTGTWTHHAGTYDGTTMRVYVNGVLEASNTVSMPPQDVDVTPLLFLGVRQAAGQTPNYFRGALDEVRVWDYVRSEGQIAATYDLELTGQEPGLLGYYQFEEAGGQTIIDSSGGTNNGFLGQTTSIEFTDPTRIASGAPIRSKVEGALLLDGADDFCRILDPSGDFDLGTAGTLEAWIRRDNASGLNNFISCGGLSLRHNGNTALISASISATNSVSSAGALPPGDWVHVAGSYDGSDIRIYVNGVLEGTTSHPGTLSGTTNLLLGSLNGSIGNAAGAMDEVRIWSTARSDADILANFNVELDGTEAGLVGYYKFNEASGQAIVDSSMAGNSGTLGDSGAVESSDPQRISSSLALAPSDPGGALLFDGIDDVAEAFDTFNLFDLQQAGTLEAWIRLDSSTGIQPIADSGGLTLLSSGTAGVVSASISATNSAFGPGGLPLGEWAHLAG